MPLLSKLRELFSYLFGKRSELRDLDVRDIVMTKAILDIHRKRTHKEIVRVPLFSLRQIHVLDRENAMRATEQRVEVLQEHRQELLEAGALTGETLARYLPSVSWIKVVDDGHGSYLAFEGNGRIAAMQRVFTPEDGLLVEVEQYKFRDSKKIRRRLGRVRRLNGLTPEGG